MDYLSSSVLEFIRHTDKHPLPPHAPTRAVLSELRDYLDGNAPDWRWRAFDPEEDATAVVVEFHLRSSRVVRGALLQRHSEVAGGAA